MLIALILIFSMPAYALEQSDVIKFCTAPNRKMPAAGKQFDGKPADQSILDLKPGTYPLAADGSIQVFTDGSFILTKPKNIMTFYGGSRYGGGELLQANGQLAGCSKEQLSELMIRNNIPTPPPPGTVKGEPSLVPGSMYLPYSPNGPNQSDKNSTPAAPTEPAQ